MRVAIYARFSSDLQDPRSITDQEAACRERAVRERWSVVAVFTDAAISGASMANRPGLLDLMRAAEAAAFDAVLCESLDRLSRDQEDSAAIHKRLKYRDITIITLADGTVSKLQVGLRSVMSENGWPVGRWRRHVDDRSSSIPAERPERGSSRRRYRAFGLARARDGRQGSLRLAHGHRRRP